MIRLFATTLLIFSLSQNAFALGMKAKDIIKKVKEKYETLKSLQADFEQTFKWELAGETQSVKGTVYLAEGNNYRIETDTQAIVTNGTTVWTYSKNSDQVIIDLVAAAQEGQLPRDLLFKYSEEYKPKLAGEEKIEGRKCYKLELIPKNEDDSFIRVMAIWVDSKSWLTKRIEQVDINDNVNTYMVTNILDNPELAPELFTFEVQPESEVVDLREGN